MIRVVLADDQALVRAGFRALLSSAPDITVVGEAEDGAVAVRLARDLLPDVVLMDIRMPGQDGLAATREIVADARLGAVRVIVLTTFAEDAYIFEAIRVGASGFLVKDIEPADLLQAVRVGARWGCAALAHGHPAVDRGVRRPGQAAGPGPGTGSPPRAADRAGTRGARAGRGGAEQRRGSASRLVVSPATAKTHVSRTMIKLAARDRAQLVVIGYESGLVRPRWLG